MSVFDEDRIDCHCHVFDPLRFPYRDDTAYRPDERLSHRQSLPDRHARALGRALSRYRRGRQRHQPWRACPVARGGCGWLAFNPAMEGVDLVTTAGPLFALLADLGMIAQVQWPATRWVR